MKTQIKIALILVLAAAVGTVSADSVPQTTNLLLGENGYIINTPGTSVSFGGITLTSLKLDSPSAQVAPPVGGAAVSSFFDVFTEISLTGIGTVSTTSPATVRYTNVYTGGPITEFATEILSLNISGGSLPSGFTLRESPTLVSHGGTTTTDLGGGSFVIDSYFDIFTELSTDGGISWIPSSDSLRITSVTPEPATMCLLGLGGLLLRRRRHS